MPKLNCKHSVILYCNKLVEIAPAASTALLRLEHAIVWLEHTTPQVESKHKPGFANSYFLNLLWCVGPPVHLSVCGPLPGLIVLVLALTTPNPSAFKVSHIQS